MISFSSVVVPLNIVSCCYAVCQPFHCLRRHFWYVSIATHWLVTKLRNWIIILYKASVCIHADVSYILEKYVVDIKLVRNYVFCSSKYIIPSPTLPERKARKINKMRTIFEALTQICTWINSLPSCLRWKNGWFAFLLH